MITFTITLPKVIFQMPIKITILLSFMLFATPYPPTLDLRKNSVSFTKRLYLLNIKCLTMRHFFKIFVFCAKNVPSQTQAPVALNPNSTIRHGTLFPQTPKYGYFLIPRKIGCAINSPLYTQFPKYILKVF